MIAPQHPHEPAGHGGSQVLSTSWDHRLVTSENFGRLARLRAYVDARRWILAVSNVVAAGLFVAGCVGFYWPGLYTGSVTAFLCGSVLFLLGALGSALLEHCPSAERLPHFAAGAAGDIVQNP